MKRERKLLAARADHTHLLALDKDFAAKLEKIIAGGGADGQLPGTGAEMAQHAALWHATRFRRPSKTQFQAAALFQVAALSASTTKGVPMKRRSLTAGLGSAFALALSMMYGPAQAADIRLLSAGAVKPVMDVLGSQFERATGHRLVAKYGTGPEVLKLIETGEGFDVAIADPPSIDRSITSGKIASSSRVEVGRIGLGIGVRADAQKPNVTSSEHFRQTLLNSKSVAYIGAGASGPVFLGMLDRLGIANEMKDKLRPAGISQNIAAVSSGEVDILVMPIPLILAAPGVELAGAVPIEHQNYIVLIAGVATAAAQDGAGEALIKYLVSSEADSVFKAKGFEQTTR